MTPWRSQCTSLLSNLTRRHCQTPWTRPQSWAGIDSDPDGICYRPGGWRSPLATPSDVSMYPWSPRHCGPALQTDSSSGGYVRMSHRHCDKTFHGNKLLHFIKAVFRKYTEQSVAHDYICTWLADSKSFDSKLQHIQQHFKQRACTFSSFLTH